LREPLVSLKRAAAGESEHYSENGETHDSSVGRLGPNA